jgi:membrane protein
MVAEVKALLAHVAMSIWQAAVNPERSARRSLARAAVIASRTLRYWRRCDAPQIAAAMAYYAIFALVPLTAVLIALAALAVGPENAETDLLAPMRPLLGNTATLALTALFAGASTKAGSIVTFASGSVIALLGAAGLFGQLKAALNRIWGAAQEPRRGLLAFVSENAIQIGLVLLTVLLTIVSLAIEAAVSAVGLANAAFAGWIGIVATTLVAWILFAMTYRYLGPARLHWHDASTGGFVTAFLFVLGQALIGYYLGRVAVGASYGAAAPVMIILVWIYYSALIVLVGAAFTRAYSELHGQSRLQRAGRGYTSGVQHPDPASS